MCMYFFFNKNKLGSTYFYSNLCLASCLPSICHLQQLHHRLTQTLWEKLCKQNGLKAVNGCARMNSQVIVTEVLNVLIFFKLLISPDYVPSLSLQECVTKVCWAKLQHKTLVESVSVEQKQTFLSRRLQQGSTSSPSRHLFFSCSSNNFRTKQTLEDGWRIQWPRCLKFVYILLFPYLLTCKYDLNLTTSVFLQNYISTIIHPSWCCLISLWLTPTQIKTYAAFHEERESWLVGL